MPKPYVSDALSYRKKDMSCSNKNQADDIDFQCLWLI